MKPILTISLLAISASVAVAQSTNPPATAPAPSGPTITISGSVRERSEFDARSFTPGTSVDAIHLLRARLGVAATINEQVSALIEVQDARAFGQTRSTLNIGAPAFDLRQAWLQVKNIFGAPLSARIGRQAIGYANERLIGRIDWRNDGQSFDAAVATLGLGDASIDVLGAALARNANTTKYNRDVFLTGAWAQWKAKESPVGVQAFFLFDDPKTDSIRYQNRYTTGLYSNGTFGGFDYEVDGAYQFGQHIQNGESPHRNPIAASLIGVRAGYTFTDLAGFRFGVGYDRLSGNDPKDPDTYGAFNTLYGTNHKFYGFMDYATNIPLHTKGMGLQDMMVNLSVAPSASVKLTADGHLLALASDPADLTPAPAVPEKTIGQELDLSATYTVSKNLSLSACYCVFDGDRNRLVATGQRKTTQWGFVSVGVGF